MLTPLKINVPLADFMRLFDPDTIPATVRVVEPFTLNVP